MLVIHESWGIHSLAAYGHDRETMPHTEAWVREQGGAFFARASTHSTTTHLSVPSIWTGVAPHRPGGEWERAPLAWDWARAAGYWSALVTAQCYEWGELERFAMRSPPDHYAGCAEMPEARVVNDAGVDEFAALALLERAIERAPRDRPLFLIYNTNALHQPFQTESELALAPITGRTNYERALSIVDASVGRLRAALARRGRLDRTAVVMTADHGERAERVHAPPRVESFYEEFAQIPMVVIPPASWTRDEPERAAALARNARAARVTNVDILPTLLDLFSLEPRPGEGVDLRGASLLRPIEEERAVAVVNTGPARRWHHEGFAFGRGPWRLVYSDLSGVELFDLRSDPEQLRPLPPEHERRAKMLEEALRIPALRAIYERGAGHP